MPSNAPTTRTAAAATEEQLRTLIQDAESILTGLSRLGTNWTLNGEPHFWSQSRRETASHRWNLLREDIYQGNVADFHMDIAWIALMGGCPLTDDDGTPLTGDILELCLPLHLACIALGARATAFWQGHYTKDGDSLTTDSTNQLHPLLVDLGPEFDHDLPTSSAGPTASRTTPRPPTDSELLLAGHIIGALAKTPHAQQTASIELVYRDNDAIGGQYTNALDATLHSGAVIRITFEETPAGYTPQQ